MTPALLSYVVAGLMKFQPVDPPEFPRYWCPGRYVVRLLAFHFIPVGWQTVGIELPEENEPWFLRDNGRGTIAQVWDHRIFIEPDPGGTRYVDEVRIDAGMFTGLIALYAALFYRYRQRRWRKLVAAGFRPLEIAAAPDP
jgi:hypothetical protein